MLFFTIFMQSIHKRAGELERELVDALVPQPVWGNLVSWAHLQPPFPNTAALSNVRPHTGCPSKGKEKTGDFVHDQYAPLTKRSQIYFPLWHCHCFRPKWSLPRSGTNLYHFGST